MKIFIATFFKPFLGIFLLILVGCSKNSSSDSDACAGISVPGISSESEITAGEALQLYTSDVPGAQYYLWSGPNGFISQKQNPAIENAQPAQSGNNDNKLVAIFCSVPVTGQTVTLNTKATGKATED
jgi:hypothetical protein